MNAIVWGRNITLEEDDVVYEKVGQFEDDEEGLGRLILTDPDEIKGLVESINHIMGNNSTDNTVERQDSYLDSIVNDLVD